MAFESNENESLKIDQKWLKKASNKKSPKLYIKTDAKKWDWEKNSTFVQNFLKISKQIVVKSSW